MKITSARAVEELVWYMKMADYPRATNRALISNLFNGLPPFTPEEQIQNRISTNVNWLDACRIAQDARSQFSGALQKPGNYFSVKLESGPIHKRDEWSGVITKEINKRLKKSSLYTEFLNNVFGSLVLHGVGPASWTDKQLWCPTMHAMEDVLIPSRTLVTMENLSYFALYRRYTAAELYRKTHGPRVDKAWNLPVVEKAIKWAQTQYGQTLSSTDALYSPERFAEDIKSNSLLYASDAVPTVNCWDLYYLQDSDKEWGWKRRMVLDCPSPTETARTISSSTKNILDGRDEFIYDPGERNYASKLSEILHFQFADGSVAAPFRYHSVRGLGFLLFSVCHLQNRLRCKLNDSTFEALLNYFRVANPEDAERLQKVDLMNLGIIPEGLSFVPPQERWQINQNLVQQTMLMNRQSMAENSTSYTKDFGFEQGRKSAEKTATEVSAEVAAATAMVGSMLQRAYTYQEGQYREICRRFCIRNSKDSDVRAARAAILKAGVLEEYLNAEQWEVAAERTIGSGNKQMELAQLNLLMQAIDRYDPDAQRIILHRYTMAAVDDPKLAAELAPLKKNLTTDSVHDAQLSAATMLMGLSMGLQQGGINHGEYGAALLGAMKNTIDRIAATGGVGTPDDLAGLQNLAGQSIDGQPIEGNGVSNHIAILAQNDAAKSEVKQLSDVLGKLMNEVKAMAQRQQEQQGEQQAAGNGLPPEDAVALKGKLMMAEVDSKIKEQQAQQKLTQAEAKFQQKLAQTSARDELSNANVIRKTQVDESATDLRTAAEIARQDAKPTAQ